MKRLTQTQVNACRFLARFGSYCPGNMSGPATGELLTILDSLVKAKRVAVENTDDGPKYTLLPRGMIDAQT